MKSTIMLVCGLLVCAAGVFPFSPSFASEEVVACKAKADADDAESQCPYGDGRDYMEAFRWWRKSAENGDAEAQYLLATLYDEGYFGVGTNRAEAVTWYRKAAENGNAAAQNAMAWMCYFGEGAEENRLEAIDWYRKAALQGGPSARNDLRRLFLYSKGFDDAEIDAVRWRCESPQLRYTLIPKFQSHWEAFCGKSEGVDKERDKVAASCRAAAERDDADAQNALGWMCYFGQGVRKDRAAAARWHRKSAEQGNVDAQYAMGRMYYLGEGVARDDAEAAHWLRKAAEQGNAEALNALGWMCYFGRGVRIDRTESFGWYRKAAERGDVNAQKELGWMLYFGEGVKRDEVEAVKWFRKAAECGNADAQNTLGWMCYFGQGTGTDGVAATLWYGKAAWQGDDYAEKNLKNIQARPRRSEIDWGLVIAFGVSVLVFGSGLWRVIRLIRAFMRTKPSLVTVGSAVALSLLGVWIPARAFCGSEAEQSDADMDSVLVFARVSEDIVRTHRQLAQMRLAANHAAIVFATCESDGGMALLDAIRDVAVKADVAVSVEYMEPADLSVPGRTTSGERITADEIARAKAGASHVQSEMKRTRFDTNGLQLEWRTVLREILWPHDYDFVEVGGIVFIAKRARIAQWDLPWAFSAEKVLTIEQVRDACGFGRRKQKITIRAVGSLVAVLLGGIGGILWLTILCCWLVRFVWRMLQVVFRKRGGSERTSGLPAVKERPENPICRKCGRIVSLKGLRKASGHCPLCGEALPVVSYCTYRPEMGWWRLYSAVPVSVKIATAICAAIVAFAGLLVVLQTDDLGFWWFGLLPVMGWWFLRQVVVGRVWLHVTLLVSAIVPACIWCMALACGSDAFSAVWPLGGLAVGGFVILPFVLPATRRWERICRGDRQAFSLAVKCDIETALSLPVQKCPLRLLPIVAFVLFVSGFGVLPTFLFSDNESASSPDVRRRQQVRSYGAYAADRGTGAVTANVRGLRIEGHVIPPSAEEAKTLGDAVSNVLAQVGKRSAAVSSNGIETLDMPYRQLGDGRSYEVEWRVALYHLLSPVGFDFFEDGGLVYLGCAKEVVRRHRKLAQERLAANRTKICFGERASEGDLILRNAIRDVASKANVIITTDYMEQGDLTVSSRGGENRGVRRTAYDMDGQYVEWRTVLREILEPFGYDFVEVNGIVRIAKWRKLAQWRREGR